MFFQKIYPKIYCKINGSFSIWAVSWKIQCVVTLCTWSMTIDDEKLCWWTFIWSCLCVHVGTIHCSFPFVNRRICSPKTWICKLFVSLGSFHLFLYISLVMSDGTNWIVRGVYTKHLNYGLLVFLSSWKNSHWNELLGREF